MRGKWSQPDVPHKGWSCVDVEDLGDPSAICEMCETQEIRYVHHMEHPDYPEVLRCGCICAGHMEDDYEGARQRETVLRSASARRERWLTRDWRISRSGNPFLNVDGYNVVIFPLGQGWGYRVENRETGHGLLARNPLASIEAAKLRAYDAVMKRP